MSSSPKKEQAHDDKNGKTPQFFCFRRMVKEISCCQPWFHARDPLTDRSLDISRSFAPSSPLIIVVKALIVAAALGSWVYSWMESRYRPLLLGFFTQWGYLSSLLYTVSSILNAIVGVTDASSWRVRCQWILFQLGVQLTTVASAGYYFFLFDLPEDLNYLNLAEHGGILPLLLLDGLVLNRIPFRWMHFLGIVLPIEMIYIFWSYIHKVSDIGNPGDSTGDSIYPGLLEWTEEDWVETVIIAALLVFVLSPISFAFWWSLSNGVFCCRDIGRYEDDEEFLVAKSEETGPEEGTIPSEKIKYKDSNEIAV